MLVRRLIVPLLAALAMTATMLVTTPTPASSAALKPRPVSVYSGEVRNSGTFFAKGRARAWNQRFVYLEKRTCPRCAYRPFKKDLTGTVGKYYFRFDGRIGDEFRITIKRAGGYKAVRRYVGKIVPD